MLTMWLIRLTPIAIGAACVPLNHIGHIVLHRKKRHIGFYTGRYTVKVAPLLSVLVASMMPP